MLLICIKRYSGLENQLLVFFASDRFRHVLLYLFSDEQKCDMRDNDHSSSLHVN